MAMVIDSLVVQLDLDAKGLATGAKQAQKEVDKLKKGTEATGEATKKAGKDGADAFAAFRREALGALALFTGGKSLMGFTKDITEANVALGNLSKQLGIAPQKLAQLHYAMKATGGHAGSVDSFLKSIQTMKTSSMGRAELTNVGGQLGVNFLDKHDHVRGDIIEQLHRSSSFMGKDLGRQEAMLAQLGGNAEITNLATRRDLPQLMQTFTNMGSTQEQTKQAQQLLADWTELRANTDKIMQQVFSDIEPSINNFTKSLTALEKAHPKAIAEGIGTVATALTVLSAILTARGFLTALTGITKLAPSPLGVTSTAGAAVKHDVANTSSSPWWNPWGKHGAEMFMNAPPPIKKKTEQETGITDKEATDHYFERAGERWLSIFSPLDEDAKNTKRALMARERTSGITDKEAIAHAKKYSRFPFFVDDTLSGAESERQKMLQEQQKNSNRNKRNNAPEGAPNAQNINYDRLTGAVAMQESGGNPNAISKAGAMGGVQLMPATAHDQGLTNPFDPEQLWRAGQRRLTQLVNRFHDVEKGLTAHNWGPGKLNNDLRKHGENGRNYLPNKTSHYIHNVNRNYATNHVVHHHHNPSINITINGAGKDAHHLAHETAQAIEQKLSESLYVGNVRRST